MVYAATTATKRSAAELSTEQRERPKWPRRLRVVALVLLAAAAGSLIQGNLALVGMSWLARGTTDLDAGPEPEGVRKFYVVDDQVWRGAQPGATGFRALAAHGVTTIVDLRPGRGADNEDEQLRGLGLEPVHMPVIDGRPPSASQVRQFIDVVRASNGRVFVHCGEGVGRAGTMAAAYKVTTGKADASDVLGESLAVGVLTLEQIAFISSLDHDGAHRPPAAAVVVSRFLDAPRQLFNRFV